MIVLDEEIQYPTLVNQIAAWCVRHVLPINALRPQSIIKDDAVVTLLRTVSEPTFVTINVADFWRVMPGDSHYCIICVALPNWQADEVPDWLRRVLRVPLFKTKTSRVGKVVRLRPSRIKYYAVDGRMQTLAWPE